VFTTTAPPADTTAPTISAVQAGAITSGGATITWATNEASDSQVEYGPTTAYGASAVLAPAPVTAHSQALTGLQPSTLYHYRVKSRDPAGNLATSGDFTFTTAAAGPVNCPCSIWPGTATPAVASESDTSPFELGVKFRSDVAGYVTGLRFYKGPGNTGTHVGNLWSSTGTNLGTAIFSGETASGWQQVSFPSAVQVTANTVYIASYHAPNGGFAKNESFFAANGVDSGPLHALASPASGGNGVYKFGASGFPDQTYNATNYWVDIVFSTTPPDTTAPTISAVQAGAITSGGATITWATNEGSDSQVEYGPTTAYGAATVLAPAPVTAHSQALTGLQPSTLYHYRVKSRDPAGNLATSGDFTFTTATAARSIDLNGSSGYAEAPNDATLNVTGDWTVEAWIKDEHASYNHSRAVIVTKGEVPSFFGGDSEVPFFVWIEDNELRAGERTAGITRTVDFNLASGGVSANAWHHVAVTMRDSTRQITMYVDGVQRAQGTISADSSAGNARPVRIGRNGDDAGHYWEGKLDDVRIWNVIRTASEISAGQNGLTGSPSGLVGRWQFDEGSGSTAADGAAPAQNATLQGGFTWSTDVHP
jgi:hypothetical protein